MYQGLTEMDISEIIVLQGFKCLRYYGPYVTVTETRRYWGQQKVLLTQGGRSWKSLDQEMVDASSVGAFEGRLDKLRQQGWAFRWLIR